MYFPTLDALYQLPDPVLDSGAQFVFPGPGRQFAFAGAGHKFVFLFIDLFCMWYHSTIHYLFAYRCADKNVPTNLEKFKKIVIEKLGFGVSKTNIS